MDGATQETISAFDELEPYKGGNDELWKLHKLNNIEKHRLLLTVGSQAGGINLGQLMAGHAREVFPEEAIEAMESMDLFLNPADKGFPLKPGFELYKGDVDEEPNPKQQFRFDVVLNESGIVGGEPIIPVLAKFVEDVKAAVDALKPRLK